MYKIIGADQKEYGPVTADQLRQWISEGRIIASTKIKTEGAEVWKTIAEFPEFAAALPGGAPPLLTTPPISMVPAVRSNQTALWAMILGIISMIPCCWWWVLGVVSIILGCIALSQIKKNPHQTGSGFAITGIVLGIISIILSTIFWLIFISFPQYLSNFQNSFSQ
jgi:hypothetical protein